jgi:hypothetical protein
VAEREQDGPRQHSNIRCIGEEGPDIRQKNCRIGRINFQLGGAPLYNTLKHEMGESSRTEVGDALA